MTKHRGFTLVELVLIIVLLGIVGVGAASFLRGASNIYLDVTERDALLHSSSFATERLARELAQAVPNSVRIKGDSTVHCVEFVPINWSAIYLQMPAVGESSPQLDVIELFDIDNNPYSIESSDVAILYPLQAAHVYDPSNNRRQSVLSCSDDGDGNCATDDDSDAIVQLSVADGFAESSPTRRVYIANTAISYCLRNNDLYRHESSISLEQTVFTGGGDLMAENITNTLSSSPSTSQALQDPFQSIAASLTRGGYTRLNFLFTRGDEQLSVVREVQIPNVP
ncbi:MAG: type II secretion system protein [Pseudomonadota bacterium]